MRHAAIAKTSTLSTAVLLGAGLLAAAMALALPARAQDVEDTAQKLKQQHLKSVGSRADRQFYDPKRFDLSDLPAYTPGQQVSGTIRIGRAKYLRTGSVMETWEKAFKQHHPGITFEHSEHGLGAGEVDIVQQRGYTFGEWQEAMLVQGHYPLEIEMATGSYNVPGWTPAFSIFVNKNNPIKGLTLGQLDGIFGGARRGGFEKTVWNPAAARGRDKNIRTWGQLGLTGDWAKQEINPNGRPLKYHIQLYFERKVFNGGSIWNENLREWAHELKSDGTRALSSVTMVGAVGEDPYGIVYADLASSIPEVKLLPIARDANSPFVELNLDTLRTREYPLFLEVYLYANREPGKPLDPKIEEFLRFVLSREGQQAIADDAKWLPLTRKVVDQQLHKLD